MTISKVLGAAVLLALAGGAQAVPVVDAPPLASADRAEINAIEQQLFDQMAREGVEKTFRKMFPTIADDSSGIAATQKLDRECGVLVSVERYKTTGFGTRAVRDHVMSLMGSCVIKWDLTFLKTGVAWKLQNVQFESNAGEW